MKIIKGERQNNTMRSLFIPIIAILLISGCDFITGLKKEAKEEKKILGYVDAYNPRIKEIQSILKEAGFVPGVTSGVMDKQTRKAIIKFQKTYKLRQTGFIDLKTKAKLDKLALEINMKKQEVQAKRAEEQRRLAEKIKKAQLALKKAGFDPGPANGIMNEKTKRALVAFKKSKGLTTDEQLDAKTWEVLRKYL